LAVNLKKFKEGTVVIYQDCTSETHY